MTGNICVYCPGGPDSDFEYSTQSYTGYEPTSMRAIRARYNPYLQTRHRVEQVRNIPVDFEEPKVKQLFYLMFIHFVASFNNWDILLIKLNLLLWEELLCVYLRTTEIILLETCMMHCLDIQVIVYKKLSSRYLI